MASLWQESREPEALGYLSKSVDLYLLVGLPSVAGLSAVGASLLRLLGGGVEFEVTPSLVALLAAGELFVGIYQLWVYVLYMREKNHVLMLFFAVAAATNLGGSLVLVPRIGILGAAWTTLAAYALQASLVILYAQRFAHVTVSWTRILRARCQRNGLRRGSHSPGEGWGGVLFRVAAAATAFLIAVLGLQLVRWRDVVALLSRARATPPESR